MPRTVKTDKHLAPGRPEKPQHLSARASAAWDRLTGELDAARIQLTPAHRSVLATAATIEADIAEDWVRVQKDGPYITTKAGLVAHPASKRLDALRRDYIKVLAMLGLRAAVASPAEIGKTLDDILDA